MTTEKWLERWQVLYSAIEAAITQLPSTTDRHDDFVDLLTNLKCFGQQQFDYFLGEIQAHPNREVAGFTGEAALTATLHQIGYDLAAITQAASQRQTVPGNTDSDNTTRQADIESAIAALRLADHIADEVLKPAYALGMLDANAPLGERPKLLTYFQKSPSVRVLPYSSVALIGVPYTIIDYQHRGVHGVNIDLLAIPHEIGHYVFWNGRGNAKGIVDGAGKVSFFQLVPKAFTLPESVIPGWLELWGEEIFADVYATFVAGPIIGIDFQDLMIESNSIKKLEQDDGHHPTPLVRPEIFEHVLDLRNEIDLANKLKASWIGKRDRRYQLIETSLKPDNGDMLVKHSKNSVKPVKLSYMRERLKSAVEKVYNVLAQSNLGEFNFKQLDVFIDDPRHNKDVPVSESFDDELFGAWDDAVAQVKKQIADRRDSSSTETSRWQVPEQECVVWNETSWKEWRNHLLNEHQIVWGQKAAQTGDEDYKWIVILQAGGWTTEGPQSNPPV